MRVYNVYNKQYEYFDINSLNINSNIGDVATADYIGIVGYDSTTNEYLIMYISQNIEISQGNFMRTYKVVKGGITPINNNSLLFNYTSDFAIV
jgi:hypothetical protein